MRFALAFALFSSAASAATLPPIVKLAPGLAPNGDDAVVEERLGDAEFRAGDETVVKRGHHWSASLTLAGAGDLDHEQVWKKIRPAMIAAGWKPIFEQDLNPLYATLTLTSGGKDYWAGFAVFDPDDIRFDLVELGAQKLAFALKPPAATPEKIAPEAGDFPFLGPLPGSKFQGGSYEEGPMLVRPKPDAEELVAVGTASWTRSYDAAKDLSTILFEQTYREALTAAGWTVVESSAGLHQSDAVVIAHYAANGRDLWAYLHDAGGDYSIRVADNGASDLAGALAKSCHVALYGITFDFNKATIKPESEATLAGVLALLAKDPKLALAIEGHTDNVGGAAPNQKLSEARAKSVVDWLVAHGVAAARLTSSGFGLTQPVASNDDAEGRARNRRVELKRPGCK